MVRLQVRLRSISNKGGAGAGAGAVAFYDRGCGYDPNLYFKKVLV